MSKSYQIGGHVWYEPIDKFSAYFINYVTVNFLPNFLFGLLVISNYLMKQLPNSYPIVYEPIDDFLLNYLHILWTNCQTHVHKDIHIH